jgi:hypothetical protein
MNDNTEERLLRRADVAGERLTALKAHIAEDKADNANKTDASKESKN